MKVVANTVRKYYKYTTWTQPILTGNGTMGGSTAAASASSVHSSYDGQPWRAFNGQDASSSGWASNNVAPPQWIQFYNPTSFMLTNFTVINRVYAWTTLTVQGSRDGSSFTNIETFTNDVIATSESWSKTIAVENRGFYKYYRFLIVTSNGNNSDVLQVKLYGYDGYAESTSSDYDFYKDVGENFRPVENVERKYYKYGTTYTMPNMTNATTPSGTVTLLSGSDYDTKQPWQLFNTEVADDWVHPSSSTYSVRYTFDEPLIAGEGSIDGYYSSDDPKGAYRSSRYLDSYTAIANFEDGTTQILDEWSGHSNNTVHLENTYNVVKDIISIDFIFKGTVELTFGCLYDFKVTHTPIIEATAEDYDFYKDEHTYFAVNPYEKGVYLGGGEGPDVLIDYSQSITVTQALTKGKYYVEIVGAGGTGSYGQAGWWQERYGGGSGARFSANIDVNNASHTITMVCGGGVGSASTLTIDGTLVATAGGGGTPSAGSVSYNASVSGITFSNITARNGNGGSRTFDVGGAYTGNAASVASRGDYGQGAGSGNGYGEDYARKIGWIYLRRR